MKKLAQLALDFEQRWQSTLSISNHFKQSLDRNGPSVFTIEELVFHSNGNTRKVKHIRMGFKKGNLIIFKIF